MREAVGGALLMYLIIPIIVILIVFIGFIMNYASAYRTANYIVTQIESCQGIVDGSCSSYVNNGIKSTIANKYHYKGNISICCLQNGSNSSVYRVALDVEFELPIIGKFNPFKVKAETKTMQNSCSVAACSTN